MIRTIAVVHEETIVDCFIAEDDFANQILSERDDLEEVTGIDPVPSVGWIRVDGEWRPKPQHASWAWNGEYYEPPTPCPGDGFLWDEEQGDWVEREAT